MTETKPKCWYRLGCAENHPWIAGWFEGWFQDYEELNMGVGHFPVAVIVDDASLESLVVPAAGCVCFAITPPAGALPNN